MYSDILKKERNIYGRAKGKDQWNTFLENVREMKSDVKVDYLELDGRTDIFIENKKREKAGNMGIDVTRWGNVMEAYQISLLVLIFAEQKCDHQWRVRMGKK